MDPQIFVFGVILAATILFLVGRPRYDIVAVLALLVLTIAGVIPADEAFSGFSHPAVVTVAAVLVASRGLSNAGVVDVLARLIGRVGTHVSRQVGALTGIVATLSAFMNNVAALALLMRVPIQLARRDGRSASPLLMPLAFASLLGGLVTLIGTPPNIIVSSFRADALGEPFSLFAFAPVGLAVALAGLIFITTVGWRLIPQRESQSSREALFNVAEYTSEIRVRDDSPLIGRTLQEAVDTVDADLVVAALARDGRQPFVPSWNEVLRSGDVLVVEMDPEDLRKLSETAGLDLTGAGEELLGIEGVSVQEAVVAAESPAIRRTARELDLRRRYGVNLLAVARQGQRIGERMKDVRLRPGDVLLLQARNESVLDRVRGLGLLAVSGTRLRFGSRREMLIAILLFGGGLGMAATGIAPVEIALTATAILMVLFGLISLRELYASVDWPVIFLLGAILPVAGALETSGGADTIARMLIGLGDHVPVSATLGAVLVGSMLIANLINKAAAVLMAPIALSVASSLGVSPDAFLMAVAVGASSAFLTPVGHQSNTLVMGPGGYRFADYWRLGLPLSALVAALGVPLILYFWPL
jgi:di/tricarboxylate transporter